MSEGNLSSNTVAEVLVRANLIEKKTARGSGNRSGVSRMLKNIKKGNAVVGRYLGVEFTGTVRGVRRNECTGLNEIEIDFPAPLSGFRGRDWDVRSGLILTGVDEGDYLKVADMTALEAASIAPSRGA